MTPHDIATIAIMKEFDRAVRSNYDPGRVSAEDLASAVLTALAAHQSDEGVTAEAVELVLRCHLPIAVGNNLPVLCICSMQLTFEGPVYHRLHVAEELWKAGLLHDYNRSSEQLRQEDTPTSRLEP